MLSNSEGLFGFKTSIGVELTFPKVASTLYDSHTAKSRTAVLTMPIVWTGVCGIHTSQIRVSDQRTCGDRPWEESMKGNATRLTTSILPRLIFDRPLMSRR